MELRKQFPLRTIKFPEAAASCLWLKLWDEDSERLVPFSAARHPAPMSGAPAH